ncbi:hypothetical protein QX776_06880 [Alteromonadaceae bacterium BrNp21-10]|nr:hypothetical protein [Alteromonadaceae bacterium BrNp21-10]
MKACLAICYCLLFFPQLLMAETEDPSVDYPWLDSMHSDVSQSVHSTAEWFDSFFLTEEYTDDQKAAGEARIMLGWEPRSSSLNEFVSRFRIRVKLPKAKHQTDLVFSDFDEEEQNTPIRIAKNNVVDDPHRFNLALRWTSKHDEKADLSHRIGIGRKLQPFVKSRYRRIFELSASSNLNWETSAYWYSRDGLGAHFMLQYETNISTTDLFRFDNHFYYRDRFNDWIWHHSAYNFHQLDSKSALIYGLYVEGNSQPNYRVEEYLISARWRKNALREWLYFEVEPFLLWRRDEDFNTSIGLAMRVEGYFGGY